MLELLLSTPSTVKVGIMFAMILILNRCGLALGASIAACALGLSAWSGTGIAGLVFQGRQFAAAENLLLLAIIVLLLFFTESLGASGRIERTIGALRIRLRNPRLLLGGLPALIGLLPMPGGALVSAPMVASMDSANTLSADHKVAINYWFRHIWEYWWPLYPGVVLALTYSNLPAAQFYALQMPLTIVAIAAGLIFVLRHVPANHVSGSDTRTVKRGDTAAALVPIGLLVAISLAGVPILQKAGLPRTLANLVSMSIGLLTALGIVFASAPHAFTKASKMLISPKTWGLVLVVAGVQMFSAALKCPLDSSGRTLVTGMGSELMTAGIPVIAVMMIVPAIAGFVTGVAVGFVGVSFPLVFGLLGESPSTATLAATTMIAYASGYAGMMLSPIHVCLVVTNEYFGTANILKPYRYLVWPAATVLAASVLLAQLYRLIL